MKLNFNAILIYKIKRELSRIICAFFPFKNWRNKMRIILGGGAELRVPPVFSESSLGELYMPYYTRLMSSDMNLYNEKGQKLEVMFARSEFGKPTNNGKIYWDLIDITLKRHFYLDKAIPETMGNPTNRYAWLVEAESIEPNNYKIFKRKAGLQRDFDLIFTYNQKLLDTLENSRLIVPFYFWYGKEIDSNYNPKIPQDKAKKDNVKISESAWERKEKNISMMCSAKIMCEMHKIRHKIAKAALDSGKVDVFGGFNGGQIIQFKSASLEKYRFQIVVENDISSYYMTEKIFDCFASMTIPIYLGAPKVGEFFNTDGIIFIDKDTDINKILSICTKQEYLSRLSAIKDNFNRVLAYDTESELLKFIAKG